MRPVPFFSDQSLLLKMTLKNNCISFLNSEIQVMAEKEDAFFWGNDCNISKSKIYCMMYDSIKEVKGSLFILLIIKVSKNWLTFFSVLKCFIPYCQQNKKKEKHFDVGHNYAFHGFSLKVKKDLSYCRIFCRNKVGNPIEKF